MRKTRVSRAKPKHPCECCDRHCPVHRGEVCIRAARVACDRVDMQQGPGDPKRVEFCEPCMADAQASGLFSKPRPLHWTGRSRRAPRYA